MCQMCVRRHFCSGIAKPRVMASPAKMIRRFDSDAALDSLPDVQLPVESSMGAELSGMQASGEGQASSEGAAKPEKQLSELSDMQHMASGEGMASTKGVAQEAAVTGEPGGLGDDASPGKAIGSACEDRGRQLRPLSPRPSQYFDPGQCQNTYFTPGPTIGTNNTNN